ncbi:MAG: ABC transporter substrate-binding protein [Herminiimonas sp.]|nr:ABC transporter substrate-binding protein [Herminiimonas sp.]
MSRYFKPTAARTFRFLLAGTAALMLVAGSAPVHAAELKIGLAADIASLDPHYLNIAPNIALSSHVFDALVHVDAAGKLIPGLALSWRAVDATTWEFKLRPGVKFHDGSAFTAEDAIFSLDRPASLAGSPGPFTSYTRQITAKQAVDPLTLRLKTAKPYGALPLDVSTIFIVSKKAASRATTDDFNSGRAMIGTGPFRFVSFKRGDRAELARNPDYWGDKAAWDKVTFRIIASNAPRTAALLAGDVDVIEAVPTADIANLKRNAAFKLAQTVSWRTIFWTLDQADHASPFVTDAAGTPLAKNPLRDPRVRLALSKAINRAALVSRTMEGLAQPASNIVSPGIFGYDAALKVETYDPEGAKKLLAEAGFPNGFNLTLHGPNNRYINDEQVVQTTAQFLSRVGIRTKVATMPLAVYFGRAKAGEFSMALLGWGTLAGDFGLRTLIATTDPATGWGAWNWGKYTNPAVDRLVGQALASVDAGTREGFAKQAASVALQDNAVIPLHHQMATWALRKGLVYPARIDEFTFAHQIRQE